MGIRFLACVCAIAALPLTGCQLTETTNESDVRWDWTAFGVQPMGPGDAVSVASLAGGEKQIVVHGVITGVNQVTGDWLTLRDDDGNELFVRCQDQSMRIPHGAPGRYVVVHGQTELKLASVEELRLCADQANRKPAEISAIAQPRKRITFYADSVLIAGDGLDQQ